MRGSQLKLDLKIREAISPCVYDMGVFLTALRIFLAHKNVWRKLPIFVDFGSTFGNLECEIFGFNQSYLATESTLKAKNRLIRTAMCELWGVLEHDNGSK